jgi:methylmalonyl-CoA mutase
LSIDNEEVRASQVSRLKQVRAARDEATAQAALSALTDIAAKLGEGVNNSNAAENMVIFFCQIVN